MVSINIVTQHWARMGDCFRLGNHLSRESGNHANQPEQSRCGYARSVPSKAGGV